MAVHDLDMTRFLAGSDPIDILAIGSCHIDKSIESLEGSEAFDFVAVEDCAMANVCSMKATAKDEFYNVGTGKRTSLKELAEKLLNLTGCNKEIQYAPRSQATLVKNRIGSPTKASAEIAFTAGIDLDDGLRRLIDWRTNHKAEVEARRTAVGLG